MGNGITHFVDVVMARRRRAHLRAHGLTSLSIMGIASPLAEIDIA